ncbi:MAG: hypothetical protein WC756_03640 [Taibaiella sp.]|jgi:hypothetical protein
MQVRDSKASRKPAQRKGKDIAPGSKRTGQDGLTAARKRPDAKRGNGLHVLEGLLRPITYFELTLKFGNQFGYYNPDLLKTVNTEEKQLQAISDLYEIVKAQPKYKNLKEPVLTTSTEPIEVLIWLLRKLGPLADGNEWLVDTYQDGKVTRYRFVVMKYFNGNDMQHTEAYLPLEFLPDLVKRDLPLHNIIVDLVALISKSNKVPLWDEDGDYSWELEHLLNGNRSTHFEEGQYDKYKTGSAAARYLALLKKRRKIVTVESVTALYNQYVATSQRKQSLKWWIDSGIDLATGKGSIHPYSFTPNHAPGNPIGADRYYKFVWSVDREDLLDIRVSAKMKKEDWYVPKQFSVTLPGQKLKPLCKGNLPVKLSGFMNFGVKLITNRYKDYFFKKHITITIPALSLLNRIEASEIRLSV